MISAKIILDSISSAGVRLTTLELVYPKFIHGEFMTHRVFSRNASSSRAVPVRTMIARIRENPAMPVSWGQNQPGMQASEEIANPEDAKALWIDAANQACDIAENMLKFNLHKQIVNRITEPFAHIHVLVTATEWSNFFELRDHKDAQPEIQALAIAMKKAFTANTPTEIPYASWHLPFVQVDELPLGIPICHKLSVARCARVSYRNHDGSNPDRTKDLELYERLVGAVPLHASPTEHQATPDHPDNWSGNFRGWIQLRKLLENKNIKESK